ncbi:basic leucine zipper transcriptional factor atf-like 3 [Plakobranchus ocellatus]|uniref:Basic leucine zipper transcriptional factor atf-like 3 n=1 Tax=Plakobranchus ocellatus TaxID=259542 RepID=A0AAV4E2H2_9GAST|nr:basic leucine zipper transcriptional factor atf-like 3 [Plakobranchus ocellatus]
MPELTSHTHYIADENNPNLAMSQMTGHKESSNNEAQAIEFQCDTNDEKILNATIKAFQSGSLTPLIKEELRCTIQSRRLAEGKGELTVEFKSPPKKKEMTEEERARYLKRRVQNREAAQRFRQKQKDTSDMLTAKIQKLERKSRNLLTDLTRLREEKDYLKEMLKNHLLVCTNKDRIPSLLSDGELDQLLSDAARPHGDLTARDFSVSGSISISDSSSPTSSVSTSCFSATPPPRPGTADSSAGGSDVFFFPDENAESVNVITATPDSEVEFFITSNQTNVMNDEGVVENLPTFTFSPNQDISFVEEVVIDTNGGPDFTEHQIEAMRLNSCSSVDTATDGRGLNASTGPFSCSNFDSSYHGHTVSSDATCLDNSSSIYGFNHGVRVYSDEEEAQKQEEKMTLEIAQSLVSELSRSHDSEFDLGTVNVGHNHPLTMVNGLSQAAEGLADSTSDLRHSLAFAHSRVHDMCDFELHCSRLFTQRGRCSIAQ